MADATDLRPPAPFTGTRTIGAAQPAPAAEEAPAALDTAAAPVTTTTPAARAGVEAEAAPEAGVATVARATGQTGAQAQPQAGSRLRALSGPPQATGTSARGVASGLAEEPPEPVDERPPARPTGVRPRGAIGPGHVLQVVCCQLAVLAVLAGWGHGTAVTVVVAAAAALLVAGVTARRRGRWLWTRVGTASAFATRTRAATWSAQVGPLDDPARVIAVLQRRSVVGTMLLDEVEVGVLEHADGVSVLLAAADPAPLLPTTDRPATPSPLEVLDATPADGPPMTAQLVVSTLRPEPAATGQLSRDYAHLADLTPLVRSTWVSLQLLRDVHLHDDGDLAQVLGHALRGVQRRLERLGRPVRALGPQELSDAVLAASGLDTPGEVRERWGRWETGAGVQATLRVARWPERGSFRLAGMLEELTEHCAASTTVSLAVRRPALDVSRRARTSPDAVELCALVAVRATDLEALEDAVDQITTQAAEDGGRLERLDGDQRRAATALSGFGGFA